MTQAMRDAWAEALCDVAADNPDLLVLDGDLGTSTRADRFADAYPERFLQMGIAEQNMVGRRGRPRDASATSRGCRRSACS